MNEGYWKTGQMLNEEADGMVWTEKEILAEGGFNLYERQPPETPSPASSPCLNFPITPSFSRSSISSDSSSRRSLFLQSPESSLSSMSGPPSRQLRQFPEPVNTQGIPQRRGIQDLPNELLYEVFEYAVDERCVYDYLVETDNAPDDLLLRDTFPIIGDDGGARFIRVRVETQLSRVCSLWRSILRNRDVGLHTLPNQCIHITGPQWFHPSFPSQILEMDGAYTHVNISFNAYTVPSNCYTTGLQTYDEPLFPPPEGSNYHDEGVRRRRVSVESTKYIRLILNNHTSLALDQVFMRFDFPMYGVIKIVVTVNSESMFFIATRHSVGIKAPITGGCAYHDDGALGAGIPDAGINLVFDINSWRPNYGHTISAAINDVSRWFNGSRYAWVQGQDYIFVKLPRILDGVDYQPGPQIGWQDQIAKIFADNPLSVWQEWDNTACGKGRLCQHQFDFAALQGFNQHTQALQFIRYQRQEREWHPVDIVQRRKLLLMLHPIKQGFPEPVFSPLYMNPVDSQLTKADIYADQNYFSVGVKGYDVSGAEVVRAQGCVCEIPGSFAIFPKGHVPRYNNPFFV